MHGLSGSGKSYISEKLCEEMFAIRIRSDIERKRLFGQLDIQKELGNEGANIFRKQIKYNAIDDPSFTYPEAAFSLVDPNPVANITGLTGVSREMIEAGRIDGASGFTMLWHIVLPQLKPATLIAVVVTIVGALRSFDLIAVMTAGGPWGSSEVLAYKMYQESLFNYRMGYGAALATILFFILDIYIVWFLIRVWLNEKGRL